MDMLQRENHYTILSLVAIILAIQFNVPWSKLKWITYTYLTYPETKLEDNQVSLTDTDLLKTTWSLLGYNILQSSRLGPNGLDQAPDQYFLWAGQTYGACLVTQHQSS
jgi:hypothetical protein